MENQRSWDGHNDIQGNHAQFAGETDKPVAAVLGDLAQRGLLDSTLVIWGGEFGRLPVAQKAAKPGRDHNPHAMVYWLAGGGAKAGTSYGATDELGHKAADNRVNLHDLHATILHLVGMDHKQMTYRHNGRDFRLTDVEGDVIGDIVAWPSAPLRPTLSRVPLVSPPNSRMARNLPRHRNLIASRKSDRSSAAATELSAFRCQESREKDRPVTKISR